MGARAGVFARVLDCLPDAVEDCFLDRRRVAPDALGDYPHAGGSGLGEGAQGAFEAALAQLRRVDAVPQRTQLVDRGFRVVDDLVKSDRHGLCAGLLSRQRELDLNSDQPVLGAIMEIAFQPQPLLRARLDDART